MADRLDAGRSDPTSENAIRVKIHERTMVVQKAEAEIGVAFWAIPAVAELTVVELIGVCARLTASVVRVKLRDERHPDDPLKRAEEA